MGREVSLSARYLSNGKANISTNIQLSKAADSSQWPVISLCCGSVHPEFRALLTSSEWPALVRNHRVAAPSVVGTHPPPSSVLMFFENLREIHSGLPSPSVPARLGKDLISVKRHFLQRGSGAVGASRNESPFIFRGFDLGRVSLSPTISSEAGLALR